MALTPELWDQARNKFVGNLLEATQAANLIELFDIQTVDEPLLIKVMRKFLMPSNPASLSSKLWDPTRVKAAVATLSQSRYSCGIETEVEYEDMLMLLEQEVFDASNIKMTEQTLIQAAIYLFTGKKLVLNEVGTLGYVAPDGATYYNNLMDAGLANGTLDRPLNMHPTAAGAWATSYAYMEADANNLISTMATKGFKNKSSFYVFYPAICEPGMTRKRDSGGNGMFSMIDLLVQKGIPASNIIMIDDVYGYTTAGAAPALNAADLVCVDRSMLKIWSTLALFVEMYALNGSRFSNQIVASGWTFCPQFTPELASDGKIYKGVCRINAVNMT